MKRYPGKFEGCGDQRLGEALFNAAGDGCDEEFGDVAYSGGWHGLIYRPTRRTSYVVHEDTQGFFDYEDAETSKILALWEEFRAREEVEVEDD